MLLTSKDRRWLSSDVQADLVLVCRDGSVPAHSAFLAGCSPFLALLLSQPSARLCGGCRVPRSLILAGVGVRECRELVELLYTGKTPLNTDLNTIKSLGLVLGLDFSKLELIRGQRKPILSHRLSCEGSDGPDGVHHRFRKSNINQVDQDLKPVRPTTTKNKLSVIVPTLKNFFQNPKKQPNNAEDQNCSLQRANRLSADLLAEPLSTFPTRKLPLKTPVISDNFLPDTEAEGQVMVPNAVLSEVMQMIPAENIKEEVEDTGDTQDFPQMEGREEDEKDANDSVTSYLSMNNSKNFVCDGCDSTFTFIRSYNWHRQRCRGRETSKPPSSKTEVSSSSITTGTKRKNDGKDLASVPPVKKSAGPIKEKNSVYQASQLKKPIMNQAGQTKERNSLYQASQLKKKLEQGVSPSSAGSGKVLGLGTPSQEGFVQLKFGKNIKTNISPSKSAPPEEKKKTNGNGNDSVAGGGRKVPCGRCVKCRLADCGSCVPCTGGGDPGLARVCVKKVCRNKVWVSD